MNTRRPAGRSRRLDLKEQLEAAEWLFRRAEAPPPPFQPRPAGEGQGAYGRAADAAGPLWHRLRGSTGRDEDGTEGGGT